MGENKDYDPGVYRRLALVEKQLKTSQIEERKNRAAEKRRDFLDELFRNRLKIGRWALYIILGLLLLAVILVVILDKI
jgi:hypothetical protein